MKKFLLLTFLLTLSFVSLSTAQMHGRWTDNDTLTTVTISGMAIVDSSMMNPMYYLDEDGDGIADYHLGFGPYFYQPDSSNAVRPSNGDIVTILGGLESDNYMSISTVMVYEINGEFWRDPLVPTWNNMGGGNGHAHNGGHMGSNCNGFTFGFDSTRTFADTTLSGTVYLDTTYLMDEFYLDTDGDETPDFMLNFGPPWYESTSGILRPMDGDAITIKGKLMNYSMYPMVVVYELNGEEWRDSSTLGNQFGGAWFNKDITTSTQICSPFDSQDWMQVNPGWNNSSNWGGNWGGMGGMMNSDSLYGQMLEVYPQNMPYANNENVFAGYEIGMFTPNGNNGMWNDRDNCGGSMNFGSNIDYQLHYNDIQVQGYGIDENTIVAKYWDSNNSSWEIIENATLDKTTNTVSFSTSNASTSVILTASAAKVTSTEEGETVVKDFELNQNYPNPFNPSTTIGFSIQNESNVKLNIYNALGQKVTTLVNRNLQAGNHNYQFDASNLSSGVYFYELKVGTQSSIKKMNLLK